MTDFEKAVKKYQTDLDLSASEARADAERTVTQWMEKKGWTRDFAEATWAEEGLGDEVKEAIDSMGEKAKASGALKLKAKALQGKDAYGKARTRVIKEDEAKRLIVAKIFSAVQELDSEAVVANVEREVTFILEGCDYSITLTKHRKPKQ